ncbi:MAG TPA: NYN domain-containing protein [Streptosporangiaceae bacterium]|nr:NYN domain-containing protein [Streptosporangiaceae bacterium]
MTEPDAGVAIYWDFENVHACVLDELRGDGTYRSGRFKPQEPVVDIDPVVEYAATLGRIVLHRAYCNWQYFGRYRDELQAHAVDLVQLFPLTASKNGADIRLALDVAEDLQQQAHVSHVIVVSSDSDFTSLAQRCRRQGRTFIGIGTRITAKSFQFACDEFREYGDLTVASITPAVPETPTAPQELGSLEDAAELVVKAVRRLAAGRGESWALKAAVRPLVKRLDPTFDERHFGFGSFTELISALNAYIIERSGDYDHELAVRADLDGTGQPTEGTALRDAIASSSPVALVERQLRRKGLRLPSERQLLWIAPELISGVFERSGTGIEPNFDSLRAKLEQDLAEYGFVLSEAEFNKLKTILVRAQVLELHGQGSGMSLRLSDTEKLRLRLITVLLGHLADPASEDPGILTEAIFGRAAGDEQDRLVRDALQAALQERNDI